MPDIIPTLLAPYLQLALVQSSSTLITSTLSTPANWLLVRLLYCALRDVDEPGLPASTKQQHATTNAIVIFASLTRPLDLWTELCKKVGLDFLSLLKSKRLHYIDGLSTASQSSAERAGVVLRELTLDALFEAISSTINANSDVAPQTHGGEKSASESNIIIDGIDFLAACQPDVDIVTIQSFLLKVRSLGRALVVTTSADAPLLHNHYGSATPLEQGHAALVSSLAHQSGWVMQVRGLDTGSASDITGVLRASRGGAYEDRKEQIEVLDEAEWLYQVKGDGGASVWSRGE